MTTIADLEPLSIFKWGDTQLCRTNAFDATTDTYLCVRPNGSTEWLSGRLSIEDNTVTLCTLETGSKFRLDGLIYMATDFYINGERLSVTDNGSTIRISSVRKVQPVC